MFYCLSWFKGLFYRLEWLIASMEHYCQTKFCRSHLWILHNFGRFTMIAKMLSIRPISKREILLILYTNDWTCNFVCFLQISTKTIELNDSQLQPVVHQFGGMCQHVERWMQRLFTFTWTRWYQQYGTITLYMLLQQGEKSECFAFESGIN